MKLKHPFSLLGFLLLICLVVSNCSSPKVAVSNLDQPYRIGFYNVENLFDTVDHPDKRDEDFTPEGRQKWDTERYQKKLADLEKVIGAMGYPLLLGLSEVENKKVVEDLIQTGGLAKRNYGIVHYESPDKRGIDCALIYQKDAFKVTNSEYIRINFPAEIEPDYTSRDIIYAEGILMGQPLHVFVNHWPSRRGGLAASEPKRTLVASKLRAKVDDIFAKDGDANILIMGDMNDEPDNNSISETLGAKALNGKPQRKMLYNCMAELDAQDKGTYNYRGNWNMLDNIITSGNLVDADSKLKVTKPTVFQETWMMFDNPKYGLTPNRTYGGPNYYGGYSDHLPVYVELTVK